MRQLILENYVYSINFSAMILTRDIKHANKIASKVKKELPTASINFCGNQTNDGCGYSLDIQWQDENYNSFKKLNKQFKMLRSLKFSKLASSVHINYGIIKGSVL